LAPSYQWFLIAFMPFGFFVGLFSPSSQSQISMIESKTSRVLTPLYHAAFSFGSLVGAFSAFFTIRYVDSPILIFSITGTALIVGALLINKFGLDKSYENLEKTPKFKLPKNSILSLWNFDDAQLRNDGYYLGLVCALVNKRFVGSFVSWWCNHLCIQYW
jgi:MFS family permease